MNHVDDRSRPLDRTLQLIDRFVAAGEIPAGALAVASNGRPLVEWYAGSARPGLPAGPHTLWPIASISKMYTAATIMALLERGELHLAQTVGSVLSSFAQSSGEQRSEITLRQLLTHTAGLIYEPTNMAELLIDQTPLAGILDVCDALPLEYAPGTGHRYSDYGFAVLGQFAATLTGTPFPELVRTLVLDPAGLHNTSLQPDPSVFSMIAEVPGSLGWGSDGAMYNSPYALRLGHPAFGIVTTLPELLHFGMLLANGGCIDGTRVLSPATVRAMSTNQVHLSGAPHWGLGFELDPQDSGEGDLFGPGCFGHGGASGCALWHDPSTATTIAYVSNLHANLGYQGFLHRISAVLNSTLAELSET